MDCIFCKIIKGEIPCYKVYEDEIVLAFLDVSPKANGHTLIIPKEHTLDLTSIDNDTLIHIMEVARKLSKVLEEKYGTTELTLSNGVKVYIKQTDFKADEIRMKAYSCGGNSLFDTKDALNFNQSVMNGVVAAGGIGNFSRVDLFTSCRE